jgi:NADH dehydrogenase FAD-containing subunit
MAKLPQAQTQRRGLLVDDYMSMLGADGVYALGDCTATQYAPTAQAASQQGIYLAQTFNKLGNKAKLEKELSQLRASPDAPTKAEQIEATLKKLNRVSKLSPFHYSHQVRSISGCTAKCRRACRNFVLTRLRVRSRTLVRRRPLPTCPSSVVTSPRAVVPPTSSGDLPTS